MILSKTTEFEEPEFLGSAVMGERGQVVIPKEIRDIYDLKSGDSLLVMAVHKQAIVFVPVKKAKALMKHMNARISQVLNEIV